MEHIRTFRDFWAVVLNPSPTVEPFAEQVPPNGGGRLASRLIQDWFAGILEQGQQTGPATECCALRAFPPPPNAGSEHDLVIIPSQSHDEGQDSDNPGRVLLSCMCKYCRYHFVFRVTRGNREVDTAHLQHHFLERSSKWYDEVDITQADRDYPLRGGVDYFCSLCNMAIQLEITVPRLRPDWIQMIMDQNRIRESLRIAKEEDPERYRDTTPEKEKHYLTTALSTLNQYLKNILDDDGTGPQKRISCRNKTFVIQFGPACNHIFRYLGFAEQYDENTRDSYWVPPRLTPHGGKTPLGSSRAFFEDVRSEVQSVLDDNPPMDGPSVVRPILARDQLEKALGCDKIPRSVVHPVDNSESEFFRALGAPVNADDALLKFAYRRQAESDPKHVTAYLDALCSLASRRGEELQMFAISERERHERKQKTANTLPSAADPIEKAYAHFGISRSQPTSVLIGVYRNYRAESPAQKADHRRAMALIAMDQDNIELKNEVYGTDMELAEAADFLSVQLEWPLEHIGAMAQSMASEADQNLVLLALRAIEASRPPDDPDLVAFQQIIAELESSRDFGSAAQRHPSGVDAGSPGGVGQAVDLDLPVGLANLRNTCYLNSILQYFYSVNAVRDLALKSELPALEPTEPNMSNLLNKGGSSPNKPDLETGRAFVGYEFMRELGYLFRDLDGSTASSVSPRQRLANAALLRPEKLRPRSSDDKSAPGSNSATDAPPLPPRLGESSNPRVPVASMVEIDQSETASADSAQTLVNGDAMITSVDQKAEDAAAVDRGQTPVDTAGNSVADGGTKTSKLTVEELAVELDKPNVGSDQMDVDEVMGNAIDHLRAAVSIAHISGSEGVTDPIERAFFSTFIDNRKKIDETAWNRTSRSDRWVTAYPAQSGARDLYDALANSFDLEPLPGDLLSYTTIKEPAPHFHICIQRADGVRKNVNPIIIPETLYLDRFMDISDPGSPLFKARKRSWEIKTRLSELIQTAPNEGQGKAKVKAQEPSKSSEQEDFAEEEIDGFLVVGPSDTAAGEPNGKLDANDTELDPAIEQVLAKYEVVIPDTTQPYPETGTQPKMNGNLDGSPADLDEFWGRFHAEEAAEGERLAAERDQLFSGFQDVAYRLHAVVCHAGATASAGHYWVWIHDFERDVWRKYNDTTVSVHPAEVVFGELNSKGEPYYLAYVRAKDVQNLVSIPRRAPRQTNEVVMVDAGAGEETATAAHVEDVDMPPLVDIDD